MDRICRTVRPLLPDLADGIAHPEAEEHLAECADCRRDLEGFRQSRSAMAFPWTAPPSDLVRTAIAIAATPQRTPRRLGILRTSFAGGARSRDEGFQIVVGDEDVAIRLMVAPEGRGYRILGRFPEGEWTIRESGVIVQGDRFEQFVDSLEVGGLTFVGSDGEIVIPPLATLLDTPSE